MSTWEIEVSSFYSRKLAKYQKKHPNEVFACLNNLDTYKQALDLGASPRLVKAGFVHPEPKGAIAIDQSGHRGVPGKSDCTSMRSRVRGCYISLRSGARTLRQTTSKMSNGTLTLSARNRRRTPMGKRYASVSDVVNEFIDDESFRERFEKEINDKRVAKTLFAIRSRAGKTQGEMAERLGCSQGTISKLENSGVDGIKVSDLVTYAEACDLNLTIGFHEEQSAAGRTHPESVLDVTTPRCAPAGEASRRGVSKQS